MQTLEVNKYNQKQTAKWRADCDKKLAENPIAKYGTAYLPQLAFYLFQKTYGYVTFGSGGHFWAKTKKESISRYENQKIYK